MDPIATIALFCNVLDLTERTYKCAKKAKEAYDSTSGLSKDHDRLLELTNETNAILDEIQDSHEKLQKLGFKDSEVQTVAINCQGFSSKTAALLDQCRSKQPHSIKSAVKATIRSLREKDNLRRLQGDLDKAQQTLHLALTASVRTQVIHVAEALGKTRSDNEKLSRQLEAIPRTLDPLENLPDQFHETLNLCRDAQEIQRLDDILENLNRYYNGIQQNPRYGEVHDAFESTFEWIFREPEKVLEAELGLQVSFVDWLRRGRGIFHILGKPGSGKSTLMKFIWKHKLKEKMLQKWAQGARLLCMKYFFWRFEPNQSRLQGLKCSLVTSALEQAPELLDVLIPKADSYSTRFNTDLGYEEICRAFDKLVSDTQILKRYKIFILLDGLDEFDEKRNAEDYYDLVKLIQSWTSQSRGKVKVCVSSREYEAFTNVTQNQKLRLQNLTKNDIQTYVTERLKAHPQFEDLEEACWGKPQSLCNKRHICDPDCLIEHIVGAAGGVFLWVRLVMSEIRRCFECDIGELWKLVDANPKEMTGFLRHILDSIPSPYQRKVYIMLAIAHRYATIGATNEGLSQTSGLSTLGASYLWWKMGQDNAESSAQQSGPSDSILQRCKTTLQESSTITDEAADSILQRNHWNIFTAEEVNTRFYGLLEIPIEKDGYFLGFSHRSIVEVLGEVIETKLDEHKVFRVELGKWACQPTLADTICCRKERARLGTSCCYARLPSLLISLKNMGLIGDPSFMHQLDYIEDICLALAFGNAHPSDRDWSRVNPGIWRLAVHDWSRFVSLSIVSSGWAEALPWIWRRLRAVSVPERGHLASILMTLACGSARTSGRNIALVAELLSRNFVGIDMLDKDAELHTSKYGGRIPLSWIWVIGLLVDSLIRRTLPIHNDDWTTVELWLDHGVSPQLALFQYSLPCLSSLIKYGSNAYRDETSYEDKLESYSQLRIAVKIDGEWFRPIFPGPGNPKFTGRKIDTPLQEPYVTFREFIADSRAYNKERLLELIDRNTAWIEADEAEKIAILFKELPSQDILYVPDYVPSHKRWTAKLPELHEAAPDYKYYITGIIILATLAQLSSWAVI
ncbi:hypothetical protein F5Y13DRAFT_186340 [Hypoxylon sp. FL1857]|nr:hypothetical protein F5Y13DRAFT_186340 [Hypoxylon sp. FL1857]